MKVNEKMKLEQVGGEKMKKGGWPGEVILATYLSKTYSTEWNEMKEGLQY